MSAPGGIPYLSAERLMELPVVPLIDALAAAFAAGGVTTPLRSVHSLGPPSEGGLYLMPAWSDAVAAVKLVTYLPGNPRHGRPAAQGLVILFDRTTGAPTLIADGGAVTNLRTAAASALAARFLARPGASHLLVIGAGALAPFLAEAHAAVRPIRRVSLWARRPEAARVLADRLRPRLPGLEIAAADDLPAAAAAADIISVATSAPTPALQGQWLSPGVHVDLVGAHSPTTRETDDAVLAAASIWIDTRAALAEAGDLILPLASGAIDHAQIVGDLAGLCRGEIQGRNSEAKITVFKSVGAAIEDLAAAQHFAHAAAERGWI